MSKEQSVGRRKLQTEVVDKPVKRPKPSRRQSALRLWMTAWVIGIVLSLVAIVHTPIPEFVARPGAALTTVVLVVGLTYRVGARLMIWPWLAVLLTVATLIYPVQALLAASALLTAISGAVLAVLATRPAETASQAIKEFFIAVSIGVSTMIAVGAWNAVVQHLAFNAVVIAGSMALTFVIVWSLGANLHGLSPKYVGMLLGAVGALAAILAYTSLVRTYGSDSLVDLFENTVVWMRTMIIGVPRPAQVLLGFPALILGVSLRSQRRDGWWLMVFATVGTGVMASAVVNPYAFPSYIGLSTLYSIILGLGIGLLLRKFVVNEGGSRAARSFEHLSRQEPKRTEPLK